MPERYLPVTEESVQRAKIYQASQRLDLTHLTGIVICRCGRPAISGDRCDRCLQTADHARVDAALAAMERLR